MSETMRLQKWMAEAGLCSRREGDKWIAAGRVSVNGERITQPGSKVGPHDVVVVDGRVISKNRDPRVVLMLNKPPGVLCTRKDPENRRNVFELLDAKYTRLISVGRLDYNSEGLILFTNDGSLANGLMHPSNQVTRTYRARVHGRVDPPMLAKLRAGVLLEDGPTGPLQMDLDYVPGANSWLTLTLTEGRNRMVRRIFEAVGMDVSRLIRIAYGDVTLGELPKEKWRTLQRPEITRLLAHAKGGKKPPITEQDKVKHQVGHPARKHRAHPTTENRHSPKASATESRYGSRTPTTGRHHTSKVSAIVVGKRQFKKR